VRRADSGRYTAFLIVDPETKLWIPTKECFGGHPDGVDLIVDPETKLWIPTKECFGGHPDGVDLRGFSPLKTFASTF
jgi:hypothetical protein